MSFVAVLLVCAMPVVTESCTENTAVDRIAVIVASELGCTTGWQEMIARGSLRDGIGDRFYIKTLCLRTGNTGFVAHLQVDDRR